MLSLAELVTFGNQEDRSLTPRHALLTCFHTSSRLLKLLSRLVTPAYYALTPRHALFTCFHTSSHLTYKALAPSSHLAHVLSHLVAPSYTQHTAFAWRARQSGLVQRLRVCALTFRLRHTREHTARIRPQHILRGLHACIDDGGFPQFCRERSTVISADSQPHDAPLQRILFRDSTTDREGCNAYCPRWLLPFPGSRLGCDAQVREFAHGP